jgi:multiple antibiotic resistance protein
MSDSIDTFLLVFLAAFPIVDPIGAAMVFFSMTGRASPQLRRRMAGRIAVYSFFFLLGSLYIGAYVLAFFGISLPVLRVAGGLVVAAAGWKMLHEDAFTPTPDDAGLQSAISDQEFLRKTFYPLTMPLTAGPGTIAVLIALGAAGTEVVIRLMAFILICIGVQILWSGVYDLWALLKAG